MGEFITRWRAVFIRVSTIPIVFLGVGLYRAWLATFFRYGAFPGITIADYAVFETSIGIVSFIFAFSCRKLGPLWQRRSVRLLAGGFMEGGSLALVVACFFWQATWLKYAGLVLSGTGLGILILMWAEFYGSITPLRVALYHSAALGIGEVIKWLFAGMSTFYLAFFALLLPFICVSWVRRSMARLPKQNLPTREQEEAPRIFPWKPILLMAVCTFATGFGSFATQPLLPGNIIGALGVCLLVFFGVLSASRWFNFNTIYQLAFPLLTIGFLLIAPSLSFPPEIVAVCYDAGYTMMSLFIMVILSNITYRFGISAVWISGLERGFRYLVETLGWGLSVYLAGTPQAQLNPTVHSLIIIVLIIVCVALLFTEKGLNATWGIRIADMRTAGGTLSNAGLSMNVASVSQLYALSPREEEVLQLLACGETSGQIEQDLYVAQGTIKAHISHIYRKLGVHSREELHELLEGYGEKRNVG